MSPFVYKLVVASTWLAGLSADDIAELSTRSLAADPRLADVQAEIDAMLRSTADTPRRRIAAAYEKRFQRRPRPTELDELAALYSRELDHFVADPNAARSWIERLRLKAPRGILLPELAAYGVVAQVLCNLGEPVGRP